MTNKDAKPSAVVMDARLTDDELNELNEKHGYFHFGDAQGDVSRAFADDVAEIVSRRFQDRIAQLAPIAVEKAAVEIEKLPSCPTGYTTIGGKTVRELRAAIIQSAFEKAGKE